MTSTISELRDALEEALKKGNDTSILTQINAFKQVQRAKRKALNALLDVVRQNEVAPQHSEAIAQALAHYGGAVMPGLLISLLDSSDRVRRVAYDSICQSEIGKKNPDEVQQFAILRDNKPDLTVKKSSEISEAVERLKVGDKNTFFDVYDILENSEPKYLPHLIDLLKLNVGNRSVASAISSIIASCGWVALPFLIRELHTTEKLLITGRIIETLGQIGSPLSLPTLETMRDSEEYEESAVIAISRITLLYPPQYTEINVRLTGTKSSDEEGTDEPIPPPDPVNFSSYCPSEINLHHQKPYQVIAYAHLGDFFDKVQEDIERFKPDLGGDSPSPRHVNARIADGTNITIIPECDEISFDPIKLTKRWRRRNGWVRFNFDFHSPEDLSDDILLIRLSIQIHGVEVSHIKHVVTLSESLTSDQMSDEIKSNPLATAKMNQVSANLYNKIFISYSRQDKEIVEMYRLAQIAIGNEVFMDTYNIRTGENWRAALARAIDDSDIFQLFWSENAAKSENVKDEWDYALRFRCLSGDCSTFIRPVYWQEPWPAPPAELQHINFRFVPFKDK